MKSIGIKNVIAKELKEDLIRFRVTPTMKSIVVRESVERDVSESTIVTDALKMYFAAKIKDRKRAIDAALDGNE